MAAQNRATRINKIVAALKKLYKPVPPPKERTLLEHLLFACLLENSSHEAAEQAFSSLEKDYFDWNEVRVSTRRELAESMRPLTDPEKAADRLKRLLQSIFESVYAFDLELMKKQNLGQSVKQIEEYDGSTAFIVAYAVQNGLSGHAIPVNQGLLTALRVLDVINEAEEAKGAVPGLERAVPKQKGVEIGSLLHQLGVEVGKNPTGQAARKVLLDIDPSCKDQLPKRSSKEETPAAEQASGPKQDTGGESAKPTPAKAEKKSAKKAPPKSTQKPTGKKSTTSPTSAGASSPKKKPKASEGRLAKRKPR